MIDAREGIRDNSRRHGYLLSMLGIRQIAVIVNKMDLVGFDRTVFENIRSEFSDFLGQLNVEPSAYIPVSGFHGDNIVSPSGALGWFRGPTVLEALDGFATERPVVDLPFRMPVQGVYKFTQQSDDRRIVAGTVETGRVGVGDEVVFYPSGKKSRVKSIEGFNRPPHQEAVASQSTGFTLDEQIYITRGELAAVAGERAPLVSTRLRVNLFWLGRSPLSSHKEYPLKLGAARVTARLEQVHRVIDAVELATSERSSAGRASRGCRMHARIESRAGVRPCG